MKNYYGTKLVSARPMTLGEYNSYRGWLIPLEENPDAEGYLVEYARGLKVHPAHASYISWTPKVIFEQEYQPLEGCSFGHALQALKSGSRVARAGWNGKGMFLILVPGSTITVDRKPLLEVFPEGTQIKYLPHIDMKTATGEIVPWLASQTDVLADDWQVLS